MNRLDYIPVARCYIYSRSVEDYSFIKGGAILHHVLAYIPWIQNYYHTKYYKCFMSSFVNQSLNTHRECARNVYYVSS